MSTRLMQLFKTVVSSVLFFTLISNTVSAAPSGFPSGFQASVVTNTNMGTTSAIEFAPDGRLFVLDLYGQIKIYKNGAWNAQPFATIAVDATGDKGLLGGIFDRDFPSQPYFYIHYVGSDSKVRVGRLTVNGDTGTNLTVLYTAPAVSPFQHAGGGIEMGLDKMIYFGIGDNGTPPNSQNLSNVFGKIHRINRDGSIPASNPFFNTANAQKTIFGYGFRNPFRLHTDRGNGNIYVGDVGFNSWEEINRLQSGKNYGWSNQEGPCNGACAYENPVYWYDHRFGTNNSNDSSIVAGPVYRGNYYPSSFVGKMFVSDYIQGFLRQIDPTTTSTNYTTFSTGNGPVVDIAEGPDGKIYYVTIFGPIIYRVDYTGGGNTNLAPTAVANANKTSGSAPLVVNFSSAGSRDPENQALTYNWKFGDGTTSTQPNPSKTYNNIGQFTVTLTVSDGVNSTPSTPLLIKVGAQPIVTITSPSSTQKFKGGDVINYAATAKRANGSTIPNNNLSTTVKLFHSEHNHPFLGPINGGTGQFTIPKTGELSPEIWYQITVEATDTTTGLTGSSIVEIQPFKANLTVNTSPVGLTVSLDGTNHVNTKTIEGVVGITRSVSAPATQTVNGVQYTFDRWSDNGARTHQFDFPATNTTLTAFFTSSNGTPTVTPTPIPNTSTCSNHDTNEYCAEYFDNLTFSGNALVKAIDTEIDKNWPSGTKPAGMPNENNFSVRWTGNFEFEGGDYEFEAFGDDRYRVWIDNVLTFDYWTNNNFVHNHVDKNLSAGIHSIKVEFQDTFGNAIMHFDWKHMGGTPVPAPTPKPRSGGGGSSQSRIKQVLGASTTNLFADVNENNTFYRYIKSLKEKGVIYGFKNGSYKPEDKATRGQLAKGIVKAFGFKINTSGEMFTDVDKNADLSKYIQTLKNMGIIGGYKDSSFNPNKEITRGEAAKLIVKALETRRLKVEESLIDEKGLEGYLEILTTIEIRDEFIINSPENGDLKPNDVLNRGQMSKILWLSMYYN